MSVSKCLSVWLTLRLRAPVNKADVATIAANGGMYHFKRSLRKELRKKMDFASDRAGGRKSGLTVDENARLDEAVEARLEQLKAAGQWAETPLASTSASDTPARRSRTTANAQMLLEASTLKSEHSGVTRTLVSAADAEDSGRNGWILRDVSNM